MIDEAIEVSSLIEKKYDSLHFPLLSISSKMKSKAEHTVRLKHVSRRINSLEGK